MPGLGIDIQEKIQNMLDEIPENATGSERRDHSLSKTSARWMANMMLMIVENAGCNNGITPKQADALKTMVAERRKLLAIVGTAVVTVLAVIGQAVLSALDWNAVKTILHKLTGG